MGRKAERIAALEEEVAALRRRASDDRHAMEETLDLLDEPYSWEAGGRAAEVLRARLADDPRPASEEGSLHWLHVKDGDRLLWRLASELVALHDAEARRLGEPTWKHHPPQEERLFGDPPSVTVGSRIRLTLPREEVGSWPGVLVEITRMDWNVALGWTIYASGEPIPARMVRAWSGIEESP